MKGYDPKSAVWNSGICPRIFPGESEKRERHEDKKERKNTYHESSYDGV